MLGTLVPRPQSRVRPTGRRLEAVSIREGLKSEHTPQSRNNAEVPVLRVRGSDQARPLRIRRTLLLATVVIKAWRSAGFPPSRSCRNRNLPEGVPPPLAELPRPGARGCSFFSPLPAARPLGLRLRGPPRPRPPPPGGGAAELCCQPPTEYHDQWHPNIEGAQVGGHHENQSW